MSLTDNIFAAVSALVLAVQIWAVISLIGAPVRSRARLRDAGTAEDDAHCAALGILRDDGRYLECRERISRVRRDERTTQTRPSILLEDGLHLRCDSNGRPRSALSSRALPSTANGGLGARLRT